MITNILELLKTNDFYGAGKEVEIAKGSREYITDYKGFKRKIKRVWRLRRRL